MIPTLTAYDWIFPEGRGNVRDVRVRWALEEVGQPYRVRPVRWDARKTADNRARQPFGQVPAFEDGAVSLFESGAIVLHIAQTRPGLLPDDPAARGRAVAWMFAALNSVEPVFYDNLVAAVIEADQPWAAARRPLVDARAHARLAEVADHLGDADWLDGAFSAADLLMVAVLRDDPRLLAPFPTLLAYVARGEARPAFARALSAHLADLTGAPPADGTD